MASVATCGIILLGNSGVGKSFLANRLLDDDEAFESRFSAKSVTRSTEWKDMRSINGDFIYSVANSPGLIEGNQKLVDENRHEIMKAFEQCPFAIVTFIFGHKNGRIPDEDLITFMRINDAYEFSSKSLLIIVNGIPSNRPDDYQTKTAELLHELIHVDIRHIYFIEKTTSDESKKLIHDFLLKALAKCEPCHHIKKQDIQLITDEISELKAQSQQRQNQLLLQEEEYANRQRSSVTPDPIQERSQFQSRKSVIETNEPIRSLDDQNRQFNEWMNTKKIEFHKSNARIEQLLQDPDRDARIKLADQIQKDSQTNREMIAQMSVPSQTIVVSKKHKNPIKKLKHGIGRAVDFVGDGFKGHSPCDSQHRDVSPEYEEQDYDSCDEPSIPVHVYDPRCCKF